MIHYRFILDNGATYDFHVDRKRSYGRQQDEAEHAPWTRLEFNQCQNCPLSSATLRHCPAAVDMEQIASQFAAMQSFTKCRVEVVTPERSYVKDCDVQMGLRALLGLVMATSGCPVLSQFRALANFHVPFATMDETLLRTVGAYLLRQYFIHRAGGQPDLDLKGLENFYQEVQMVNQCLNSRLVSASENDANLNAICSLTYVSMGVAYSLDDNLNELRKLFFPEGSAS
jgi:hypothetical protein